MAERDYVLGTQDEEIQRLGLQHRVWRPRMLDVWRRAGISHGHHVIDVGSGPGFASVDLAEIVGPAGSVLAIERSQRFVRTLEGRARQARLANIHVREADVAESFGEEVADFAWCRWVLCFVPDPRAVLANIVRSLKPGGVAIFHEYADYGTWQMLPPNETLDHFRDLVMKSWRDAGGEPDIGLHIPSWLSAEGMDVDVRSLVEVVTPDDFMWQWPASFLAVNPQRLCELGYLSQEEAAPMGKLLEAAPAGTRLITPMVAEIVARRR